MILALISHESSFPTAPTNRHTYTEYNFRNTFVFRERVFSHHSILKDYVYYTYIWPDFDFRGRSMLSLNWSLSEGRMRRRARLCFQTAPLCSIPATGRSEGGCGYFSVEYCCKNSFYKLSNCSSMLNTGHREISSEGRCEYFSVEYYCKDSFYTLSNCFPLSGPEGIQGRGWVLQHWVQLWKFDQCFQATPPYDLCKCECWCVKNWILCWILQD